MQAPCDARGAGSTQQQQQRSTSLFAHCVRMVRSLTYSLPDCPSSQFFLSSCGSIPHTYPLIRLCSAWEQGAVPGTGAFSELTLPGLNSRSAWQADAEHQNPNPLWGTLPLWKWLEVCSEQGEDWWPIVAQSSAFQKMFTAELFSKQDLTLELHYVKQIQSGFAADEASVGGLLLTPPRTPFYTEG